MDREPDPLERWAAVADAERLLKHAGSNEHIALLGADEPRVRALAARKLRSRDLREAIPALTACALVEGNDHVRSTMVGALVHFAAPESRDFFIQALGDDSERVRGLALRGLSMLGAPETVPLAERAYESDSVHMKLMAIEALSRLDSDDARAALARLAESEPSWLRRRFYFRLFARPKVT